MDHSVTLSFAESRSCRGGLPCAVDPPDFSSSRTSCFMKTFFTPAWLILDRHRSKSCPDLPQLQASDPAADDLTTRALDSERLASSGVRASARARQTRVFHNLRPFRHFERAAIPLPRWMSRVQVPSPALRTAAVRTSRRSGRRRFPFWLSSALASPSRSP
jgi:hypothetical protein